MGGGRKAKKGQNETGGAEGVKGPIQKKRGTERGDSGRNTTREPTEREREREREREERGGSKGGLPHLELLVNTVQGGEVVGK